jgi:hypothetical protein
MEVISSVQRSAALNRGMFFSIAFVLFDHGRRGVVPKAGRGLNGDRL